MEALSGDAPLDIGLIACAANLVLQRASQKGCNKAPITGNHDGRFVLGSWGFYST